MPGIAVVISAAPIDSGTIDRMNASMCHEPTDVAVKYVDSTLQIAVGRVCRDDKSAQSMAVWNKGRNLCLVLFGETFADPRDVRDHKNVGECEGVLQAAYVLSLYEKNGLAFAEKANGWFFGVLIDIRERKVVLFNDRYGLARVYFHQSDDTIYFSSEAKAVLRVLPQLRRLDLNGMAETISCGAVLQNRTLYKGLSLLPPASRWVVAAGTQLRKNTYFTPESWEQQQTLDEGPFYSALRDTFARIVPKYLTATTRPGMSLTGGLDGRLIMAWSARPADELPCYTFASSYGDSADVKIAREVAKLCRQPHQTIVADGSLLADFPSLSEKAVYISDGAMDVTGAVELYVNRIARKISPVRITGNYGSEILRRNVAFRPNRLNTAFLDGDLGQQVGRASETYREERDCHTLSFIAFKQVPWHHYSRLSLEQSVLTIRSPFLDNELVSLMYRAPPAYCMSKAPSLKLVCDGNPELAKIPTDRGVLEGSRAWSRGLRCLWQELTVRSEYAYDYGMPQWLTTVDHLLAPVRPERLFLGRHKFHHFRVWYRDRLSSFIKDVLLDPRTKQRPFFHGPSLERMVMAHVGGTRNYTTEIHRALTLELIQRHLIEG